MSTLMFWNKQNGHDNKNGKKNWLHAPDNLVDGHIVYRAKVRKEISIIFFQHFSKPFSSPSLSVPWQMRCGPAEGNRGGQGCHSEAATVAADEKV